MCKIKIHSAQLNKPFFFYLKSCDGCQIVVLTCTFFFRELKPIPGLMVHTRLLRYHWPCDSHHGQMGAPFWETPVLEGWVQALVECNLCLVGHKFQPISTRDGVKKQGRRAAVLLF